MLQQALLNSDDIDIMDRRVFKSMLQQSNRDFVKHRISKKLAAAGTFNPCRYKTHIMDSLKKHAAAGTFKF